MHFHFPKTSNLPFLTCTIGRVVTLIFLNSSIVNFEMTGLFSKCSTSVWLADL